MSKNSGIYVSVCRVVIALAMLLGLNTSKAFSHEFQESDSCTNIIRPVNSMFSLQIGSASILDTYLTPIRYKGKAFRFEYNRYQAMKFSPEKWVMQLSAGATYNSVDNYVKSHKMQGAFVDFSWGMMHRWRPIEGLQLYAGASTSFDGGAIYNPLNSNNPASVKLHWSINPTAMAVYNIKLWKVPMTFRYQATISMFGLFFSPDYGESYFEMYVGNHSGLVHPGWWGNRFDMQNAFTVDVHIGNTVLRAGYSGFIQTSWICNINTQIYNNMFTIGVGGDWMNVSRKTDFSKKAKILSAIY